MYKITIKTEDGVITLEADGINDEIVQKALNNPTIIEVKMEKIKEYKKANEDNIKLTRRKNN